MFLTNSILMSGAVNKKMNASIASGLLAYWGFNQVPYINDSISGTSLGASVSNVTYTNVISKNGFYSLFNGTNSSIYMPTPANFKPSNFSVSAWVYANDLNGYKEIFEVYDQTTKYLGFEFRVSSFYPQITIGHGSTIDFITASERLNLNTYYLLTATFDGTAAKIYVNGVLRGSQNITAVVWTTTTGGTVKTIIGANLPFGSTYMYFWNGIIDELAYWNRALSEADVSQLYNNGNGFFYT